MVKEETMSDREELRSKLKATAAATREPIGFNFERVVERADAAYWRAREAHLSLEEAETVAAEAADDLRASDAILRTAAERLAARSRLPAVVGLIVSVGMPAALLGIVWLLSTFVDVALASVMFGFFVAGFIAAAVVATSQILPSRFSYGRLLRNVFGFVISGSSIAAGAIVLLAAGLYMGEKAERRAQNSLVKVNEAASAVLAYSAAVDERTSSPIETPIGQTSPKASPKNVNDVGRKIPQVALTNISDSKAQSALVQNLTGVDWIVFGLGGEGSGTIAVANLPVDSRNAVLRLEPVTGDGVKALSVYLKSPLQEKKYATYWYGEVVTASARNVTLKFAGGDNQSFLMPDGTLPLATGSKIVAAVSPETNQAIYLQPVDGLLSKLEGCNLSGLCRAASLSK